MPSDRSQLPPQRGGLLLTDAGLETSLIVHDGIDPPHVAAVTLLREETGREALRRYVRPCLDLAATHRTGLVLESPTWRASRDWGVRLGCDEAALVAANRDAIALCVGLRDERSQPDGPIVVSGCIGPRGDGYVAGERMSAQEARRFHALQVDLFAETEADLVTAITMTYAAEATGIALAAKDAGMPVVISFTVETDGHLPSGQPLDEAIQEVDAATAGYVAYYMINCAHPAHFADVLRRGSGWQQRIGGLRANASARSHAELEAATELDIGDPEALAEEKALLAAHLPNLCVVGGCCGTDHRHVAAMAQRLARS